MSASAVCAIGRAAVANDAEALVAVDHYHGYPLDGRTLVVNEARPREERGGGGHAANRGSYRSY